MAIVSQKARDFSSLPNDHKIYLQATSGPKRYDFQEDTKEWVYSRDRQPIDALLSEELSAIFEAPIRIEVRS